MEFAQMRTQPAYSVVDKPKHDFRPSRLASTKPVVFQPAPKFQKVAGFSTDAIHRFPGMELPGPHSSPQTDREEKEGEEEEREEEDEGTQERPPISTEEEGRQEPGSYEVTIPHTVVHHYSYDDGQDDDTSEEGDGRSPPEEYHDSLVEDIRRIHEEVSRAFRNM